MDRVRAYEGKESYIFVSYAHKDSAIVLPVIESLFKDKYRVWYDEGITPGSEWPHNIATHLENADTVIIFVSDNSLASINCENEVVRARELNKNIIAYNLNNKHKDLSNYKQVDNVSDLINSLDERLIGDGISGYEKINEKGKKHYLWNIVLGLSILLAIGLGYLMYGINSGIFDEYLPARQTVEVNAEKPQEQQADTINSDLLAQAILSQLGKDELMKEVELSDVDSIIHYCENFGYDYVNSRLTYFDLTNDHRKEVNLYQITDEMLELLKYYPELETIRIYDSNISTLIPFKECPYLKEVVLDVNMLPLEIDEDMHFNIYTEN